MSGGSAEQGDSNLTEQTRENEREEGRPSLVCLAFVRQATAPANAASIDLKDWRRGVYEGLFLEDNNKKFWVDKRLHKNCLLVLPKSMAVGGGAKNEIWQWTDEQENCFRAIVNIRVPVLLRQSWVSINGTFLTNPLSPMTMYEVSFVVKLRRTSSAWPLPVNLGLHLPDGSNLMRTESLAKKRKEKWIKLHVGEFVLEPKNVGEVRFYLHETCQIYKKGLVLKGLLVDPKD